MKNKVQGSYEVELKFVDESRVYLNFWNVINGDDVCCQIKDGKLFQFIHSPQEVEEDEILDEPKIENVFEQKEITLNEFIELVQTSILSQ